MSWHTEDYPELRSGPPWVMEEMIGAQPGLAEAMASSAPSAAVTAIRDAIGAALDAGRPVTVIGCGTSEHGAHGVAALLASAAPPSRRPLIRARPSFAALGDPADGVCLAVSHDGGTRATELAALAAREAGATVAAITFDAGGSVAAVAMEGHVLTTPVHDASWCHTIAYTSALLAGAQLAGIGLDGAAEVLRDAIGTPDAFVPIAERLADRRVVLCAGAGADHVTARELSLKIAEGARLPTIALELETVLHGQLAGSEAADGLVLVALDETSAVDRDRLLRRTEHVARAAAAIGIPVAVLLSSSVDAALPAELTPAGRVVVGDVPPTRLGALLAGAGALQSLTLALAHARGTNPDLIRREEAPYRAAAEAAEGPAGW